MTPRPQMRGGEPREGPPWPAPDVLAWDLEAAVETLAAFGRPLRLVPAGDEVACGALRWRVARQTVLPDEGLLLVIVPEGPGPAQEHASSSGGREVEERA